MNPKVQEWWGKALDFYRSAQNKSRNGESDSNVTECLHRAVCSDNGILLFKRTNDPGSRPAYLKFQLTIFPLALGTICHL